MKNKNIISVDVLNNPGVLIRITSLFTKRGYNIDNIGIGQIVEEGMVRLTIVANCSEIEIARIKKQLLKIIDVVDVSSVILGQHVEKEMALVKFNFTKSNKSEFIQLIKIFKGSIVDASLRGFIVELTGTGEKIEAFLNLVGKNNIVEVSRSGVVAMNRWNAKPENNQVSLLNASLSN